MPGSTGARFDAYKTGDDLVFQLDHVEFGEVYYAMMASALGFCGVGWTRNLGKKQPEWLNLFTRVFGTNEWTTNSVNYRKSRFREDIAEIIDENTLSDLRAFYISHVKHQESKEAHLAEGEQIALLWNRVGNVKSFRDSSSSLLEQIASEVCIPRNYTIVLLGQPIGHEVPHIHCDETGFFERFDTPLNHLQQLSYIEKLIAGRPCISLGVQSGAMDGPALFLNTPTIFFSDKETASNGLSTLAEKIPTLNWLEIEFEGDLDRLSSGEISRLKQMVERIESTITHLGQARMARF